MKRFVYNIKYAKLLIGMIGKTQHIDKLAKKCDANTGHLRIVLDQWHKEGIIHKSKPGISYNIKLTNKGKAISLKLAELIQLDERWEETIAKPPKNNQKAGAAGNNLINPSNDLTANTPQGRGN